MTHPDIIKKETKDKIINIIAKLDNGSHSSSQLQGVDEALTKLFESAIDATREATLGEVDKKIEEEKKMCRIGCTACTNHCDTLSSLQSIIKELKQK